MLKIEKVNDQKIYCIKNKYLLKKVINERIKLDDIGPAIRLVALYNRHKLINNRVMERLYNCLRNDIYITCSMYDELKSLEDEKENVVDKC